MGHRKGFFQVFLILIFLISTPLSVYALPAPPSEIIEQLENTTEQRVEAVTILGGNNGAVDGFYEFKTTDNLNGKTSLMLTCRLVSD
ncbi:MAG TPA: hypothetical protein VIS94_05495 [Desulfomonilia bacterium]